MKKYIPISMATALMAVCFHSCEYKELDEHPRSPVSFVIDFGPGNVDSIPQDFFVVFYPIDHITQADGQGCFVKEVNGYPAEISGIPAGHYRVSAWNKFLEHTTVDISGNRNKTIACAQKYFSTAEVPIDVLDSLCYGQAIYDTPDYMVHANDESFVLQDNVSNQVLTLHPDSMVVSVDVRLGGIASLGLARQVKGVLSNVAKYRYIAYDNNTLDTCTVMFDCHVSPEDSTIYGTFHVFGVEPSSLSTLSHKMILFFWLNGSNIYIPIDITEIIGMHNKEDKRIAVNIADMGIDLSDYIPAGGTFNVDVSQWDDVEIDISW